MDAEHWTGDDTRDLGSDYEAERCQAYGAGPLEDCTTECDCEHCQEERRAA